MQYSYFFCHLPFYQSFFTLNFKVLVQVFLLFFSGIAMASPSCDYQQRICECERSEEVCYFTFVIEDLLSSVSYPLIKTDTGRHARELNGEGIPYSINNRGELVPKTFNGRCSLYGERFLENNCSIPMTIDSVGDSTFIGVNGLIPGPTLVVNYNQTVVIDVTNLLINKEISIHWHGQFQNNTPWMDGVDHITQCPIPTYASFRYIFKAAPSGTMWYHSHTGTERTEGLFGALVVREAQEEIDRAQSELQTMIGETFTIIDDPQHTLTFLDWQDDAVEITLESNARIPFFIRGLIPPRGTNFSDIELPNFRLGPDRTIVSRVPFVAGLINGLGRQTNISYENSRLSVFNVQYYDPASPQYYRFRLVGSQRHDMFNFSISEHKLIVIATDGFLAEPIEVDYLFIHAGERYDFLLRPKTESEANGITNFLISAETLDAETTDAAEAFLHYGNGPGPRSPEYESIINNTVDRDCNESSVCEALNCPFQFVNPIEFITCIPVSNMQLLFATPSAILPSNVIDSANEYFFDFSFVGSAGSASINGRNFAFPSGSLLTQPEDPNDAYFTCESGRLDCNADRSQCICLHLVNIDNPWATVQFVLTNIGSTIDNKAAHPIHLHGHSFQVVGIYYGEYYPNGTLKTDNPNVTCDGDETCTDPGWTGAPVVGSLTNKTIRKDTIVVPPGGYVVLRFISDNWGFWYMHCHIEPHFLEGMALVVNEAYELQSVPPSSLFDLQCGNFTWTVDEFNMRVSDPLTRGEAGPNPQCPGKCQIDMLNA